MEEGLMHWSLARRIGKSQDRLTVAHLPHRKGTKTQRESMTHPGHTGQGTKQGSKPQSRPMASLPREALLGCTGEKKLLRLGCDFSFPFFFSIYLCIWLCRVLVAAHRSFSYGVRPLSYDRWDLIP